jgi:hypothetical protein
MWAGSVNQSLQQRVARRPRERAPLGARRFGYVLAGVINAALLFAVNVWPGWSVLPFLTDAMPSVLGLINASMVTAIVVNAVYVARDTGWIRPAGELVTTGIGLLAAVRVWRVFPFDFAGSAFPWATVVRVLLVLAIVGSVIALITNLVALLRARS